jgi:hypothetical protein
MLASLLCPPVATDALSSPGMMDMGVAVLSPKVTATGPSNWACRITFSWCSGLQPVEMLRLGRSQAYSSHRGDGNFPIPGQ